MKVLLVVTSLGRGGAEVQASEVAKRLAARGDTVRILALTALDDLVPELSAAGVTSAWLGAVRGRWSPSVFLRLRREIREFQPDVVHTHTFPPNLAGRLVRSFVHVPALVTSAHNVNEGGPVRMAIYRLTDRLADVTTNCSEAAVESFLAKGAAPPGRIRVLRNGVDLVRFRPDPVARARKRAELGLGDRFVWAVVGRLMPQKDLPNLLAACVDSLRGDDLLLFVGYDDLDGAIHRQAAAHGDRVRFLGERPDVPALMAAVDAYVMSSAWEGLPMVLLEAAASGLPIVATRVGGNAEIVEDRVTGRLVPPRDPAALAAAMLEVRAMSAEARQAMGERGRARVARGYGIDAVADTWQAIYREALAAGDGA